MIGEREQMSVLSSYCRHCKQEEEAEKQQTTAQPALDLGLKEGQRLRLNINTRRSGDSGEDGNGASSSRPRNRPMPSLKLGTPTGVPGLLPPPPSAANSSRNRQQVRGTVADSPVHATVSAGYRCYRPVVARPSDEHLENKTTVPINGS